MKLFIWMRINGVTASYHNEGGLAILADTIDSARSMIECSDAKKKDPDIIYEVVGKNDPIVLVFPDAGCCG